MGENYEVVVNGSSVNYSDYSSLGNASTGMGLIFPLEVPHIKAIVNTCYILVFLCCIIGNLLVILVVLVHQKMRTITNFFLANLAVADFLVGVFCIIPAMEYHNDPLWKLGSVMCKLYFYVQCISYNASIAILTAISIERYFAIIHPMRSKQMTTLCLLRVVIIIIWIFAAVTGIPLLFFYHLKVYPDGNGGQAYCMMRPGMTSYAKAYVTATFIFLFLLPLFIMSVIYIRISVVLWKTSKPDGLTRNTVTGNSAAHNTRAFLKPNKGKLTKTVVRLDNTGYEPIGASNVQNCTSSSDEAKRKGDMAGKNGSVPQTGEEDHSLAIDDVSDDLLEADDYENDWPTDRRSPPDGIKLYRKTIPVTSDPEKAETGNVGRLHAIHRLTRRAVTQKVQRQQNALTARRKVIRLLIAVVLAFTVCVLPYHIRFLHFYYGPDPETTFANFLIAAIIPLILYFQSGLNPILYAFLSENFRKSLHEMICCRHRRHHRSLRSTTMSMKTANSTL